MNKMINMLDLLNLDGAPDIFTPEPGKIVKGTVIYIKDNQVLVDLGGVTTGIISGSEAVDSINTTSELAEGDEVEALVLAKENDEGLVVLSLRRASQQRTWKRFVELHDNKEPVEVKITDANKGGLLVEVDSIKGFLPVSQLAPMHYPRVNGANSAEILGRLQALIGKKILVRVINVDFDTKKLIFSEKAAYNERRKQALSTIKVDEVLDGTISGVVNFGIFVTFNGLEGLVHISEIAWGHVDDPARFGKLGDKIKVKVIGIEGDKISLSLKKLIDNPWDEISKAYTPGMDVKGKVSKVNDFGCFVTITDDINGLIHVTELNDPRFANLGVSLDEGSEINAKIVNVDKENHRISLTLFNSPSRSKESNGEFGSLKLSAKAKEVLLERGLNSLDALRSLGEAQLKSIDGLSDAMVKKIIEAIS